MPLVQDGLAAEPTLQECTSPIGGRTEHGGTLLTVSGQQAPAFGAGGMPEAEPDLDGNQPTSHHDRSASHALSTWTVDFTPRATRDQSVSVHDAGTPRQGPKRASDCRLDSSRTSLVWTADSTPRASVAVVTAQ